MFYFWLVWRYMKASRRYFDLINVLTLLGVVIGVASLVVAMSVVSGFETTLQNAVTDVFGHVLVVKHQGGVTGKEQLPAKIKKIVPELVALTPYVELEAVAAGKGKISGVFVHGVDPESVERVLSLRPRVIQGEFKWSPNVEAPSALIGKGLAKKFSLKPGDFIQLVIPQTMKYNSVQLTPKLQRFEVTGILDLGKYDYDERAVVTTLQAAQAFGAIGTHISGLRLRLTDPKIAKTVARRLNQSLGYPYAISDWFDVNSNLFKAIEIEKPVIFFVLLLIVVTASFNVAITLYVTVLRRISDISILRATGANQHFITRLFSSHGLFIGSIGSIIGLIVGVILSRLFVLAQARYNFFPGDIYKLDRINAEIRFIDLFIVVLVTLVICFLATLAPARRGSRLNPVEGLRHE